MSRYSSSSSYASRYGEKDDDYSSHSRTKPADRDRTTRTNYTSSRTSTYSPKTYDTSSYSSPSSKNAYSSKYESYASKYANSNKQYDKKMDNASDLIVPIAKDEIEELNYGEPTTPTTPTIADAAPTILEQPEVLQESQIEDFNEEEKLVEAEATLTITDETPLEEEIHHAEPDLDVAAVPEAVPEELPPVSPKPIIQISRHSEANNIDENRTPSPVANRNGKIGAWPPKNDDGEKTTFPALSNDVGTVPKKRVSDLIARFNNGSVDGEAKKTETSYKSEYGAGASIGKLSQNQFE